MGHILYYCKDIILISLDVLFHNETGSSFILNSCKQILGEKGRHFYGRTRVALGLATLLR